MRLDCDCAIVIVIGIVHVQLNPMNPMNPREAGLTAYYLLPVTPFPVYQLLEQLLIRIAVPASVAALVAAVAPGSHLVPPQQLEDIEPELLVVRKNRITCRRSLVTCRRIPLNVRTEDVQLEVVLDGLRDLVDVEQALVRVGFLPRFG